MWLKQQKYYLLTDLESGKSKVDKIEKPRKSRWRSNKLSNLEKDNFRTI